MTGIEGSSGLEAVAPMLEEGDHRLYCADLAQLTITCDPETGSAEYELKVTLTKKVDSGFTWFTRFDRGSSAEFIGASIVSPKIDTTHRLKHGADCFLTEIAVDVPGTVKTGESVSLTIKYRRTVIRTEVTNAQPLRAKKVLLGFFLSLASECKRLEITIVFKGSVGIERVLTPAKRDESTAGSVVRLTKDSLSPQQFTPVTVLLDCGSYKLLQHAPNAFWTLIGYVLGKLL